MSEKAYDITAIITLLSTEMGGRKKSVTTGYRPSFSFNSLQSFSGEITLVDKNVIFPGDSANAQIKLLPSKTIRKTLKKNDSFIICEGKKNVGTGIIKSIVSVDVDLDFSV